MTRLRELGLRIGSHAPGQYNAITDVTGVRVGHATLIEGDGPLVVGKGPVRTGVTVIQPRSGHLRDRPVLAGTYSLNGNGEFTGLEWIRESGILSSPVALTNTHSVGIVRDALVAYDVRKSRNDLFWSMPVVGETYDGILNDINGQHVRAEHVFNALETAASGPVPEGNVGGGTGMICHGFKGGIGTSSRILEDNDGGWTVGVIVQANYGRREDLRVSGVPVGERIAISEVPDAAESLRSALTPGQIDAGLPPGSGSIIIVVATDAPLLADQCRRLAVRAALGMARVGGGASDASGDLVLAFATGNADIPPDYYRPDIPPTHQATAVSHQRLGPLFQATIEATEESIVNALLSAETMVGRDGIIAYALDPGRLLAAMTHGMPG